MPEEIEVPTEHLHEKIHEEAEKGERWVLVVAMSTAMLAVAAAIASLLAGHHANEALLEQISASDQWSYYQAKGVKSAVLEGKMELLKAMDKEPSEADKEKLAKYKEEQEKISEVAKEKESSSHINLAVHTVLAKSVTFFQIAIAVAAISAITKKKPLWYASLGLGAVGIVFLVMGLV
jgi:hypothetical protein